MELTEDLYEKLITMQKTGKSSLLEDKDIVDKLTESGILTTKLEDQSFLDEIILKHNRQFYSKDTMDLTILPTITCNLKCPYCYETSKPKGVISKKTCDKIIEFIKKRIKHEPRLNLGWSGGEPLLGIDKMEYLLNSIKENGIKLLSHSIVTNATLLKGKALDVFEKFPLDDIQVTFDGIQERHDKLRIHHNDKGTFDEILKNLDEFVVRFPKTDINIRVNIGTHNSEDFIVLKEFFHKRYPENKNIIVYPGILAGGKGYGYNSHFFSSNQLSDFHTSLLNKNKKVELPSHECKGCVANYLNGFVIGPKGELYKCWEDAGKKEREIGSIIDGYFSNYTLYQQYMLHGSFIDDKRCLDCGLLPICEGGCSFKRIENKFEGKRNNLCDHYKLKNGQSLKKLLYLCYQQQTQLD